MSGENGHQHAEHPHAEIEPGQARELRELPSGEIEHHLEKVLGSEGMVKSYASRRLLTYLVQRSLQGADGPKEVEIAIDVFARDTGFTGGDDSVVRVGVRTLRQKLLAYYADPGRDDRLVFDIPKGSYKLTARIREPDAGATSTVAPVVAEPEVPADRAARRWRLQALVVVGVLLLASLAANAYLLRARGSEDPELVRIRESALWSELAGSNRPLMFLLGDMFMYTQTDPATGRLQWVRDSTIISSDDLRAFLASRPELAADRGLRYASYVQKSTAAGIAAILPILNRQGRQFEVRLRDELRAEDMEQYDIVYLGPVGRIGPLAAGLNKQSRFRFDRDTSGFMDTSVGELHAPEGELSSDRTDYALVSRVRGPGGNLIMIITAGGRGAGLAQVIRSTTSPEGLERFDSALQAAGVGKSDAFEALLSVTGYKQTDLSADIMQLQQLR
jgi:hypothetical protein